ncbi:glycoside hydrolase family 65 protein [uncultured Bacteroides sp.]|uniref:glycoside hydrolase family 65 protein n=1 Tax=uncultured Bacteroides sp. TaxID=162156 RepID=UPI002AAB7F77|nr:glycoside hydrolase family 65 protein [uncultured Bacteroides sp.]
MKKFGFFIGIIIMLASRLYAQDPWRVEADHIEPDNYFGVTVANGMLGLVSSPQPLKVSSVILAGSYDLYGRGRVSNFLNVFNMLNMQLSINGNGINNNNIKGFRQVLDMKKGMQTSLFAYKDEAEIEYSYLALRQLPFSAMLDITITPLKDITITATNILETPDAFKDSRNYYNQINRKHVSIALLTSSAFSPTGKLKICASSTFIFPEKKGEEPQIVHTTPNSDNHSMKFTKELKAGVKYHFSLVGSTITSAYHPDPLNEVERLTIFARLEGSDRLLSKHIQEWDKLWDSDITIEGDLVAQQDVHNMMYHLYSFVREGSALSISPMGLSGLGYNGHIFWDADTWMFPALLMLHPEMARSFVDYRFDRLEAAKKNAFEHGFRGAMYPWESSDSGFEETPVWALSGTFEHHISGCVALAAWNYYLVTKDKQWLKEKGFPIIRATAEFWLDRVERNVEGNYEIRNVVAADEWAENIDNDAFTNGVARINLEVAAAAAAILQEKVDKHWMEVAQRIVIHKFDNMVTKEHKTYNGEGIKQADVNLLAYPLGIIKEPAQIKRDLEYYEVRVPEKDTPAMTQAIFSLLYARLGDKEKAYHFFKDAYVPNLNPPFRIIAETKGGSNPYFITGAGGLLQTVMMGFGGLEITPNGIIQKKSSMPSQWKSLTIKGVGVDKKTYIIK